MHLLPDCHCTFLPRRSKAAWPQTHRPYLCSAAHEAIPPPLADITSTSQADDRGFSQGTLTTTKIAF